MASTHTVHSYCYICLLAAFLLVKVTALEDNCGRLKYKGFHSEHCELCSLCSPQQEPYSDNDICKSKNREAVYNGTEIFLWCANPLGPFPECEQLPPFVTVNNCSNSCKENGRRFAPPQCICSAHCGKQSFPIRCTEGVSWNVSQQFINDTCKTSITEATVASVSTFTAASSGNDVNVIILGVIVTAVIIFILAAAAVVLLLRKKLYKLNKVQKKIQNSSSSTSDETEGSSQPLVPRSILFKNVKPIKMMPYCIVNENNNKIQEDKQQASIDTSPTQDNPNKEQHTCQALQELLSNREEVIKVCKLFDQEYNVQLITWHSIARRLLKMDPGSITHSEYCKRPVLSGSPSDGPTYGVLKDMQRNGISLLDLIKWLQEPEQRDHLNVNQALQTLQQFYNSLFQHEKIINNCP